MPTFHDFQRAIHTRDFWQADEADRDVMWSQYANIPVSDVTSVNAYQLGLLALQEMARMGLIVKALALEQQPAEPKRRPRAPRANGEFQTSRPPEERPMSVIADPEAGVVTFNGVPYTPEEVRDIGEKMLQGAAVVEAINPGVEDGTL
jgi:hypothetical protein